MPVERVSTFVAPDEYSRQATEARRRRRMAEILAQQAYQPTDVSAPIPAAAPLVQGLQAYLTARQARKADEAEEAAGAAATRAGEQVSNYLFGGGRIPKTAADLTEVAPAGKLQPQTAADLTEVTPEGAYIKPYEKDPAAALRLAMTPAGTAAMKGNPMLAAALAQSMERPKGLQLGAVDPSKFTPQSIAAAMKSGDPSQLQPVAEPAKPPTVAGGMMWSAEQGRFVPIEGYAEQQRDIARAKRPDVVVTNAPAPAATGPVLSQEEAIAAGFAPGTVVRRKDMVVLQSLPQAQRVSQANKGVAVDRVDQVAGRLMQQMDKVSTGGPLGVTGVLSRVFDSQDAKLFESYRQQLSAALRSALRIPGEGALSDYEQQMYGLQLPELGQSAENNIQIINSLKEQVRLAAGQDAGLDEEVVDLPPRR
jgi:hypothetical protein